MKNIPSKIEFRADLILSVIAAIAAIVWMILIFAIGMSLPSYIVAAIFIVCAAGSALLRYHGTKDLPEEEKVPAPPLAFLRTMDAADRHCIGCGGPLRKNDKFCAKCGTKVI